MNLEAILKSLKQFTDRERVEFLPLAPDPKPVSDYAPIHKYALDLKNGAKPESAAEALFRALCKDVLGFQPTRQVSSDEGWVDFMLPERMTHHAALAAAALSACGFSAKKDLLARHLALDLEAAAKMERGQPGTPGNCSDPKKPVRESCIQTAPP